MQSRITLLHIIIHPNPNVIPLLHSDFRTGRRSIDNSRFASGTVSGNGVVRDAEDEVGLPCKYETRSKQYNESRGEHDRGQEASGGGGIANLGEPSSNGKG